MSDIEVQSQSVSMNTNQPSDSKLVNDIIRSRDQILKEMENLHEIDRNISNYLKLKLLIAEVFNESEGFNQKVTELENEYRNQHDIHEKINDLFSDVGRIFNMLNDINAIYYNEIYIASCKSSEEYYKIDSLVEMSNSDFIDDCKKGNTDNVRKCLENKVFQSSWENGMCYAAQYGHLDMLKMFIEYGVKCYDSAFADTGFHCCIETAEYLANLGASSFEKAFDYSLFYKNSNWENYVKFLYQRNPSILEYALNHEELSQEQKDFLNSFVH